MNEARARSILLVGNFFSESVIYGSVGEALARRLTTRGWTVFTTSDKVNRFTRMLDMLYSVWTRRHDFRLAHIDVFSGHAFLWAELVCWMLRRVHKPYVLTLRGGDLPVFAGKNPRRVHRLFRSASAITSPSRYLLEEMKSYRDDIVLIPNPLDLDRYPFRPRSRTSPRLVWVRAFHDIYNPSLVPRMLVELVKDHPDIRVVMVGPDKGDGSLQETHEVASRLGVGDRISFPGPIPKKDLVPWLEKGDIFINSTNIDNTPTSVLEAMACGLCVVSSNVGGIPYLLKDGSDALLVPPGDPAAMSAAVHRLLTEHDLAERLSCNARRKTEGFAWTIVLPQWESLFMQIEEKRNNRKSILLIGNFQSEGGEKANENFEVAKAKKFKTLGWDVHTASDKGNRLFRLAEMLATVWRERRSYTVAHVSVFSGPAFVWAAAVCLLLKLSGKPYVVTLHGGDLPRFAQKWPWAVKKMLRGAKSVTTPSTYLRAAMKPFRDDVDIIPNSVEIKLYSHDVRDRPRPQLIWLRAFHAIYNPVLAPLVLANLARDFPDVQMLMIGPDTGDGSLNETKQLAARLGVDKRISFPGRVPKLDVPHWLNKGDIFINTSNIDNTPVSVLEAMACGLCVVSTNVGGMPALVNNGCDGLLVPPEDPDAMADAIRRVLTEPALASRLSSAGRQKVEQFDWEKTLPRWQKVLFHFAITCYTSTTEILFCELRFLAPFMEM
jgi:glycosyltransferase involved in cell wall biosynthesis